MKLSTVKPAYIVEMMNKYKEMSDSQVKKIMLSIRGVFETAIDNDLCVKNPARNVKAEGAKRKEKEVFSESEIAIIEKFCFEERSNISDALIVLLYTGLRREELLGLMWNDIDFTENTITVTRSVILELNTKIVKEALKNDHSKRVIPLLTKASQYTADEFVRTASHLDVCLSYSLKSCRLDNAPMQSFNANSQERRVFSHSLRRFRFGKCLSFRFHRGFLLSQPHSQFY